MCGCAMASREFFAILVLISMMPGSWARAETPHLCSALLQLERFPVDLAAVRSGRQSPAKVLLRVKQVERAFHTQIFTELFSTTDLKQIESFTDAISQQLINARDLTSDDRTSLAPKQPVTISAQLKELFSRYGCRKKALRSVGSDWTTAEAVEPRSRSSFEIAGYSFSFGTFILSLGLLVCAIVFLMFVWFSEASKRARLRRRCHTMALLTFGNNCTVTHVLDIGRRGAKLQAPMVNIPTKRVELHLAGYRIVAKQAWANRYFLGLAFENSISAQMVAYIVGSSRDEDQLSRIG